MSISEDKVNVFLSYSWDSEEHKLWVQDFARHLEDAGANVLYDKKDLRIGSHLKLFMERMIISADIVLLILTKNYKERADRRKGGVGYEYNIINTKLFENILSNEKYLPVLRAGNKQMSVPLFLEDIKYIDLRDGKDYEKNLNELISQILKSPLKQFKKKHMETKYKETSVINEEIKSHFTSYFEKIFGFTDKKETVSPSGIKLKVSKSGAKKNVRKTVKDWESDIIDYRDSLRNIFSEKKFIIYENMVNPFKSKVFRNNLWTVSSALRTHDPDLAAYKKHFADVLAEEVLDTVKNIIQRTNDYIKKETPSINYDNISEIDDLKMDFLDNEEMFLNKIIGFGIRSEILHRLHPAHFPVMTQRSLWGMFFLSDNAHELITIEKRDRKGIVRVTHNWQYDYARFTYYNNFIVKLLSDRLKDFNIELNPELRFGYVNLFLIDIAKIHKLDIKELHEWSEI